MMGQTMTAVAGSTLRRIVLALLVATLMAAMLAVSVSPAFASPRDVPNVVCDQLSQNAPLATPAIKTGCVRS
jgi:hypothetical protein